MLKPLIQLAFTYAIVVFSPSSYAWDLKFTCPVEVKKMKYDTKYVKRKISEKEYYWREVKSKDEYGRVIKDEDGSPVYKSKKFFKYVYYYKYRAKLIEDVGFEQERAGEVLQERKTDLVFFVSPVYPPGPDSKVYYGIEERSGDNVEFYGLNYDNSKIKVVLRGMEFARMRIKNKISFYRAVSSSVDKDVPCKKNSNNANKKSCDAAIVYKGYCSVNKLF